MANKRVKKIKKETIKVVEFRVSDEWISLVVDSPKSERPSKSELLSIIKHSIVILQNLTGFTVSDILTNIHKDIKDNIKDRHKMLVEDWPENQVKDFYKIKNDAFKRWK